MLNKVLDAIKKHDCVVVFTLCEETVIEILNETELRGDIVGCDIRWRKVLRKKGKFTFNNKSTHPVICLDSDRSGARIYFTKDPLFKIFNNAYVIKDYLLYPEVRTTDYLPESLAINKLNHGNIIIKTDGSSHYEQLRQQLILNGISYSDMSTGEDSNLYITNTLSHINKYNYALIYGLQSISCLSFFSEVDRIIFIHPTLDPISKKIYEDLIQSFDEINGMVGDIDYFSFKLTLHPKRVKTIMAILELLSVVQRVYKDDSLISIRKIKTEEFNMEVNTIPDGDFTIHQLSHIMKIPRNEVLLLLKKYEGNGIVFNYQQKISKSMWSLKSILDYHQLIKLCEPLFLSKNLLTEMVDNKEAINQFIEKRIEQHCIDSKTTSLINYKNNYNEIKFN